MRSSTRRITETSSRRTQQSSRDLDLSPAVKFLKEATATKLPIELLSGKVLKTFSELQGQETNLVIKFFEKKCA